MPKCPSCARALPEKSRFCSACGAVVEGTALQTQTSLPDSRRATPSSYPGLDEARFLPGNVVAGRYRIVGLLGRGGMGEVYRADDLKLGQVVALKFLPRAVESDPDRLRRFLNEVRLALRITHPNVCRVHDIGEVDGQHFISMEYVDGEDLSSLLRRIGRLPQERAVEIARQLCSGLAAAHDQGILHRDLKPANVMIDGRGRARITDFGLADLAGTVRGAEVRAGTPSYMAPEQLEGREVSERSDIYALGLVLYEMFSGKPAFRAGSVAEMLRMQQSTTPSDIANVRELDPAVEQAILRALSADPARRPPSALALAAALPGGDPLAAALAAGETPSPEMVAEAGGEGGMAPGLVAAALLAIVAGLVLIGWLNPRSEAISLTETPLSIGALNERARLMIERLGYDDPPGDMAHGTGTDGDYVKWLRDEPASMHERIRAGRPAVYAIWHRRSPERLRPANPLANRADLADPPMTVPGMVTVAVDPRGRLVELTAVPPDRDPAAIAEAADSDPPDVGDVVAGVAAVDAASEPGDARDAAAAAADAGGTNEAREAVAGAPAIDPDAVWADLFREADLDPVRFTRVEPAWTPNHFADRRAAWEGTLAEAPEMALRVEAAAFDNRAVSFRIVGPWTRPRGAAADDDDAIQSAILAAVIVAVLISLGLLGRRNIRQGRSDLKGARRVGLYVFAMEMVASTLTARYFADPEEAIGRFLLRVSFNLFLGALVFTAYVALEPYVRRLWPRVMISWTRLLSGRLRDPQVGRDVLVGAAFGVLTALLTISHTLLPGLLGMAEEPLGTAMDASRVQPLEALATVINQASGSVAVPMLTMVVLVVLRLMLRRTDLALGALLVLSVALGSMGSTHLGLDIGLHAVVMALTLYVLMRVGLMAAVSMWFFDWMGARIATLDPSSWMAHSSLVAGVALLLVAGYAAFAALGGRALFDDRVLGDAPR